MLSRRCRCPFLLRRDFRLLEHVRKLLSAEEATLVDEAAQICGLGHIRRGRHDPVGKRLSRLGEVQQDTAERRLGGLLGPIGDRKVGRGTWRERGGQSVEVRWVAVILKKTKKN